MYVCEVHPVTNTVIRTVVAPSIEWCEQNITTHVQTGTESGVGPDDEPIDIPVFTPTYWLETADPYTEPGTPTYAGPGFGADPAVPERFCAEHWDAATAQTQQQDGEGNWYWKHNTQGKLVFHNGKIWRNLNATGSPNVWEPGIAAWREYPVGDEHPVWIQPVGAVDAYPEGFVVEHAGKVWRNVTPANVWAPGTGQLWEDISPVPDTPPVAAWVQPTGGHDAYAIGDRVSFNGSIYESSINANVWSPTAYPAGWTLIGAA